ncbi:hypothetical protein [Nonomuraea sp. NPDC052265]|uniref:hypothetical protein n=1 Tax=Nonomuraea sp. NPDC052265 TaxID=3364374 RepID=UPI0037CAFACA
MDRRALYRDPYPLYARARAAPGLTFVEELDAWLVARHDDVREVLSRPDDFSSKGALRPDVIPSPRAFAELAGVPGGAPVVLSTDGEAHQRYRRPLTRGLAPGPGEPTAVQRDEIASNVENVMLAGHLTTTALLGSAVPPSPRRAATRRCTSGPTSSTSPVRAPVTWRSTTACTAAPARSWPASSCG